MDVPVSVIIPCYCCSQTIERTIKSVAQQTHRPSEVLLIEDGSPDDTLTVLKRLKNQYPKNWLKIIPLSQNYGVSTARNTGWNQATQPYIAFLDSDDIWHPCKIEWQYQWMIDHPNADGSGHGYDRDQQLSDDVFSTVSDNRMFKDTRIKKRGILISNPMVTPSLMLKTSIPYRFDVNKRYAEDFLLWQTLILSGYALYYLDFRGVFVLNRTDSLSKNRQKMRWESIKNYLILWQNKQINLLILLFFVFLSLIKHIPYTLTPQLYFFLRRISQR